MSTTAVEPMPGRATANELELKGGLLVHVPTSREPLALRIAAALAERSGARVIGVGAEAFEPARWAGEPYMPGSLISGLKEELNKRILATEDRFVTETQALQDRATWYGEPDFPHEVMTRHAAGADWVVAVRPEDGQRSSHAPPISELIMRTGLPVLIAPHAATPLQARRIVVGWSDTREARRAISDAMPLLAAADHVSVVAVAEPEPDDPVKASLEEMNQRLKHRGCKVVAEFRSRGAMSVAQALIAAATGHGADLIVIGGYAHSRLQEWILGGVTRELIADCPVYVLASH